MSALSRRWRTLPWLAVLTLVLAACTAGTTSTAQPTVPVAATPVVTDEPATAAPTPTPTPALATTAPPAATTAASPVATAGAFTLNLADSAEHGEYLVGPDGLALYIFLNDSTNVSNCSGDCATAWPPLTVEPGETPTAAPEIEGDLATIERDDGTLQVTWDGAPLYYYAADTAPGDTTGQGVGDVWFLAQPDDDDDDDDADDAGGDAGDDPEDPYDY